MSSIHKQIKKLPKTPGVYFFLGPKKKILYIGKATSLRDRVKSYFTHDILDKRGPLIARMITRATDIEYEKTDSVLEALLLESHLIKTHKPRYNTDSKDDKSFNHVVITDEDFPRVLLVRGQDIKTISHRSMATYGPFPHGTMFREALRLIRKIFPFYDTKHPVSVMAKGEGRKKLLFNQEIGLYPSSTTTQEEYRRTIRHLRLLFEGKKKQLVKDLEREMKRYAKEEKFEQAEETKRRIFGLKHIQDVSLIKEDFRDMSARKGDGHAPVRIEAYDIAHLAGENTVGVMTVVVNGESDKNSYRKFIIRTAGKGNDTAALSEVLERRLHHSEWQLPRLIVVDGGTAQMSVAKRVLEGAGVSIPVVGVVKDERHRPREIRGERVLRDRFQKDILLANSEAHRFAISFHRYKRRLRT